MLLEYDEQQVFTKSLDIVDIGNTALRGKSDDGIEYCLVTITEDGKTSLLKFGPVIPETPFLVNGFSVLFSKFDFKEKTIMKNIEQFFNDSKKRIVLVEEVTSFEIFLDFPDISNSFNISCKGADEEC